MKAYNYIRCPKCGFDNSFQFAIKRYADDASSVCRCEKCNAIFKFVVRVKREFSCKIIDDLP